MCVIVSDLKCFFVNSVYTCVALVQVEKLVLLPLARGLVWFTLFSGEAACLSKHDEAERVACCVSLECRRNNISVLIVW